MTSLPAQPPDARPKDTGPTLVVPAYFHPAVRPDHWQWLAEHAPQIGLVVLNIASGPGTRLDEAFLAVLGPLHRAGIRVIGYVNTDYGRRDARAVLTETGRYQDWYGVRGMCLDQVAAGEEHLGYYAGLADGVRAMGAEVVLFNHGVHPAPGYARHADLLGTFEGTWLAYQRLQLPHWIERFPPSKFYHVVHSVPVTSIPAAWRLASRRRAGAAYVTERGGGNPYDGLPQIAGNGAPI